MILSAKAKDNFKTNPAQFIEQESKEFVRTSPANRLSFMNDYIMWDKPLVKFAYKGCDLLPKTGPVIMLV